MNGIKSYITYLITFVVFVVLLVLPCTIAHASLDGCNDQDPATPCNILDPACQASSSATLCQENSTQQTTTNNSVYGPNGIITKAIKLLSIVIGIAAVIMIIIGGFQYVLSTGDQGGQGRPNRINQAKNTILYAIIGLVIAATAQAIVIFVINKL